MLNKTKIFSLKKSNCQDSPRGPVASASRSQCRGPRFNPWSGNQIPHDPKSLQAVTKTWHRQINMYFLKVASSQTRCFQYLSKSCLKGHFFPAFFFFLILFFIYFLKIRIITLQYCSDFLPYIDITLLLEKIWYLFIPLQKVIISVN